MIDTHSTADERVLLERFQKYKEEVLSKVFVDVRAPNPVLDTTPEELLSLIKEIRSALQKKYYSLLVLIFHFFL
jgi:phosphoenolpyruvate carboxylase